MNGYVNGERGKTLIDPDTVREIILIDYYVAGHSKTLALMRLEALLAAASSYLPGQSPKAVVILQLSLAVEIVNKTS